MKPCEYCGRENEDAATQCKECAAPFEKETLGTSEDFRRALQSPVGLAITSGLAVFLITTGIYCAVGRVSLHIFEERHQNSIAPPYTIIMFPSIGRLLLVGFIVFAFTVCWMRCQKRWQAIVVAIVTLGIMALPRLVPGFLWIVPAMTFGTTTNSSLGFYVGSAFQLGVGAWLLGWFRGKKQPN